MTKTIAVFGAGTGLGTSIAHRFGAEGYRVALVGRRRAPLDAIVERLSSENIEAAAFTADLAEPAKVPELVAAILERFGRIDVVEYGPTGSTGFTPATGLTADLLQGLVNLYLLTPVEIVNAVLPGMLDRGDGGILISQGASAVDPRPYMSGPGPVMAAARNYVHSLHGELAGKGIYVGTLSVSAMIDRSAAHEALVSGKLKLNLPDGVELPVVDPDELAGLYWELFNARNKIERIHPPA